MNDDLLTTQALTTWLRITRFSVYRYIRRGLPHYRLGAQHRFKKAEVEAWMKKCADGDSDGTLTVTSSISSTFPATSTHSVSPDEACGILHKMMR